MITLDVTTDNQSGLAGMISGLNAQLPFAYAVALNDTANQVQSAIQNTLAADFHLRQPAFIVNTVYRKPSQDFATKTNLVAAVRINPDRDFLGKFEDGGEKVGQHSLAVPIMRLDGAPNLIIQRGDPLSVQSLMAAINAGHGKVLRTRRTTRKGVSGLRVAADPNRVALIKTAKGTFIIQHTGPGRWDTRVLYAFKKQVPLPPSLHFDETALPVALERFTPNFERALEVAIASMR